MALNIFARWFATKGQETSAPNGQPRWLAALSQRRKPTAYGLEIIGLILVALACWLWYAHRTDAGWQAFLIGVFGIGCAIAGVWHQSRDPESVHDLDATRILVLLVGGCFGLDLVLNAVALAYQWWSFFTGGLEAWQGEGAWHIWVCLLLALAGLVIMFASLMLARSQERTSPALRRLLYGSNAVMTGSLLLALLAVLNVAAYVYLPAVSDWTSANIYTLSSQSVNILQNLEKPLTVYVIQVTHGTQVQSEVENLLDNCRNVTGQASGDNKLKVEYLSRDRNPEKIRELIRRYSLVDIDGLLLVYGSDSNEQHQFIKADELTETSGGGMSREKPKYVFKGETALINAINYLEQGKTKAIVYFTQGNGELDLSDFEAGQLDQGAAVLRDRLQKANYEVKGLRVSALGDNKQDGIVVESKKVPEDAAVVVIAGPRKKFTPDALAALREYMSPADPKKTKGKMVVLLDVVAQDNKMIDLGLKSFLGDFNVEVGDDQILKADPSNPLEIVVTPNPRLRQSNEVASAFAGRAFPLYNARTVRPRAGAGSPPAGTLYQADILLVTDEQTVTWADETPRIDPTAYVSDMVSKHQEELLRKATKDRNRIPVAVAVSEPQPRTDTADPHAFMRPQENLKPRLIVIGDATLASNFAMEESRRLPYFSLFASMLSWLRERPHDIGIEPKNHNVFTLDQNTNVSRMIWLPTLLMVSGVVGLGLGVWVVRRR